MNRLFTFATFTTFFTFLTLSPANETVTVIAPSTEAGEDLDLQAVGELFKDSKNIEAFEKSLNDSAVGINNLDLDSNGEVDFIRVVEEVKDETHVVVLQVQLAENEFQDVATLEVEKTDSENYNMQVRGDEVVYGPNYYVAPAVVRIHTWPVMVWMYRPGYHPYRSVYGYRAFPVWHRHWYRVAPVVYRSRTVVYSRRGTFVIARTNRVMSVHKVVYRPRHSTLVRVRVQTHPGHGGHHPHRVKVVERRHH